jgi:hypothetical protein
LLEDSEVPVNVKRGGKRAGNGREQLVRDVFSGGDNSWARSVSRLKGPRGDAMWALHQAVRLTRIGTPWRSEASKEVASPRLFETLKSRRRDGWFAVQQGVKAHERRFRGSTEPRSEGRASEGRRLGEERSSGRG